ncbi:hypothetical protein Cus16_3019 [Curtobacterium sp. ER1/6]|nr:hypothetical protein Cus16_3019 [Curtobacterium sp. ER1/6]
MLGTGCDVPLEPRGELLDVLLEPLAEELGEVAFRRGDGHDTGQESHEPRVGDVLGEGQADVVDGRGRLDRAPGPAQLRPAVVGHEQQRVPDREDPFDDRGVEPGRLGDDARVDVVVWVQTERTDRATHDAFGQDRLVVVRHVAGVCHLHSPQDAPSRVSTPCGGHGDGLAAAQPTVTGAAEGFRPCDIHTKNPVSVKAP